MKRIYIKPIIRVIEEDEPLLAGGSLKNPLTPGGDGVTPEEGGEPTPDNPPIVEDEDDPLLLKGNTLGWDDLSGW